MKPTSAIKLGLWISAFACIWTICATPSLQAQVIVQWTFETSQPRGHGVGNWFTNISAEVGVGTASSFHAFQMGVTSPTGNGSAHSLSSSNWIAGDFYQFALSTAGYSNLSLSFDQASSSGGPSFNLLQFSTDGVSFSDFGGTNQIPVNGSPNPIWNPVTRSLLYTVTYDLSSLFAINDASVVYFRLLDTSDKTLSGGNVSPGAVQLVDNVTVATIPEPQAVALLATLTLLARCVVRKCRPESPA